MEVQRIGRWVYFFVGFIFPLFLHSEARPETMSNSENIQKVPASVWQSLAQKRIFFGHQSVGNDILDGMKTVMKTSPQIRLRIVETRDSREFQEPIFAHSPIGRNAEPATKLQDFTQVLEKGVGEKADIAFLKLCFVDILPTTDVKQVFEEYKTGMKDLKARYPHVTFIHITVPLTFEPAGFQGWIKKTKDLIKKVIGRLNFYDNTKRNQFNELMRKEYEGKAPLFDLARIECTDPTGKLRAMEKDGHREYFLLPEYTDDGGHLNNLGKKIVAEKFLLFLARNVQ